MAGVSTPVLTEDEVPDVWTDDSLVYPKMLELVECLCAELAQTPGGNPCFCGVVPGSMAAMDFCDCDAGAGGCGMAWVRLDQIWPSNHFPAQSLRDINCSFGLAAHLEVGVTRCISGMDARGRPPGVVQQAADVAKLMADMAAVRRAILCCFDPKRAALGVWRPLGPTGNCAGGIWYVTFQTGMSGGA
jgi:hypothetical protein